MGNTVTSNAKIFKLSCREIASEGGVKYTTVFRYLQGKKTRSDAKIEAAIKEIVNSKMQQLNPANAE